MIKMITQKCPCGYLFQEKRQIEIQTIRPITLSSIQSRIHNKPTIKENIVKREILNGNEMFKKISVLTDYYHRGNREEKMELIVCPKCGTILMPAIAMQISVDADIDD